MKEIGIVICNYNKSAYVVKCIETVLASDYQNFDIYVVDNASTDNSVQAIKENYKDVVTVLENQENLGGSGWFNTGIRKVLEGDYKYVYCLDNDVQITPDAIGALHDFLEKNPKVGMVGSKVKHLQMPDYVQQMGLKIRFDCFSAETLYADCLDSTEIPEIVYCDTVAACSVMLPTKVVREVGMMPEDNFIYWDDMEWGYVVSQAGYQVAAIGASVVYHEMSANMRRENTFSTYYLWRNQLHFFMKYTPDSLRDNMCFRLLSSVFDEIYTCMYREEHNVATTIEYAFFDAIMGKRGKAEPEKILPNDSSDQRVLAALQKYEQICVKDEAQIGLEQAIRKLCPNMQFVAENQAQSVWKSCHNIMTVEDTSLSNIYVDENWNILLDAADVQVVEQYSYSMQLFIYMHQNVFHLRSKQLYDAKRKDCF